MLPFCRVCTYSMLYSHTILPLLCCMSGATNYILYGQMMGTVRRIADDDVYIVMSVSICSHKDNYYTIIPSIYDQLGDSVDCSI